VAVAAKRFVDIEHALRWAYRDELPKRGRTAVPRQALNERVWSPYLFPAGYPQASPSFREATDGGPSGGYADGWSCEPGFHVDEGPPYPDALVIDAAVEDLRAWRGHGFGPDDPAGLTSGFEGGIAEVTRGHPPTRPPAPIDHLQAGVEAVAMMPGLIFGHARVGTRPGPWRGSPPKWSQELPRLVIEKGRNGKDRVLIDERFVEVYEQYKGTERLTFVPERELPPKTPIGNFYVEAVACPPTRKGLYRSGAYRPLVWDPPPGPIVTQRAEYAAWRMGLEILHQALEGRLTSIAPLPAAAPWRRWAGEGEAHGRVPELFKALRNEPYRRETREQVARRRQAAKRRLEHDLRAEQTRPVRPPATGRRDNNGTDGA
jgi:hypothetical protein